MILLMAMLLIVPGTVYTDLYVPESLVPMIGVIVGGGFLLEIEWDLSNRLRWELTCWLDPGFTTHTFT